MTLEERAENPEYDSIVVNRFGSIGGSMLTLMMLTTFDSVGAIYTPMCKQKPVLVIYFIAFMLLVSICLMNLVTAVIVESSFEQAAEDKEIAKLHKAQIVEKMMPDLRDMFKELDIDKDGEITLAEFGNCDEKTRDKLCELFDTDDIVELFEVLDVDGGGSVSIDEFCDEMCKLATTHQPLEQIRLLKQMSIIRDNVLENQTCTSEIMQMIQANTDGAESRSESRIGAVEREVETLKVSFRHINRCLLILLDAAGKSPPPNCPEFFDL
jgi:Ca2+-binding EF-hand superfamily protein